MAFFAHGLLADLPVDQFPIGLLVRECQEFLKAHAAPRHRDHGWIIACTALATGAMRYLPDMTRLRVRVTPRASRDAIEGFDDAGILRVRVTAPPVDGAANKAVTKLLASALGIPQRDVVLVSGATSRIKVFEVGLDEDVVAARLRQ